ncbi:MAG: hypothetical protein L0Z50_14430 [Verrucomicrobiales bacterium]|nr:hypothetical protein [Verrucomicrobiales bacterium]
MVTLKTGSLKTGFTTPPYFSLGQARGWRFVYETRRASPQPVIPLDLTIPVRAAVPHTLSYQLNVGGVDQGNEVFVDTSGLDENRDEPLRVATTFDASALPTGSYPYAIRFMSNYRSSRVGSTFRGRVSIVNQQASPFGAGWSLEGLQRLHLNMDGTVLLSDGDGDAIFFDRADRRDLLVQNSADQNNAILRYHAQTGQFLGAFVAPGAGGLTNAHNPIFGPDGNLYVVSRGNSVLRFNGLTGDFIDVFVESNPRQTGIAQMAFGPDGNLYTDLGGPNARQVLRYSGLDGSFLGVAAQGNGIQRVCGLAFGPDGLLYVADQDPFRFTQYDRILRFNGATGQFIDVFVNSGNLDDTCPFEFGSDGHIYMADQTFRDIRRFNGASGVFMGVFASGAPISVPSTPFYARSGPDGLLYIANEAGIHRYRDNGTNGVLVDTFITGNTGFLNFLPERSAAGPKRFDSPAGDYSRLVQNADGTFTRRLKDGTQYQFDKAGLLVSVADRNRNTTSYAYDAQARVAEITDPAGWKTTFAYQGTRLERITDPAGRVTGMRHDANGNLVQVTFPDATRREFGYDARHLMITETDSRGFTTAREYDGTGRFVRAQLPDGSIRQSSNAQSVGLVDLAAGLGTPAQPAPVRRPSDAVSTFTDGENRTVTVKTDAFGQANRTIDAAGIVTLTPSDAAGNVTQVVQPSGRTLTATYDTRGNPLTVADSTLKGSISVTYDSSFNEPLSFTDAAGKTTTFSYNAGGDLVQVRSPLGRQFSATYDGRGLLASYADPLGTTAFGHDTNGNVTERSRTVGTETRREGFAYTGAGYIGSITDAENRTTQFSYDPAGHLSAIALPGTRTIGLGYDADGHVAAVTPPGRTAHSFAYNSLGLVSSYSPPDIGTGSTATTFTYDKARHLIGVARPGGHDIRFAYDNAGRVASIAVAPGQYQFSYEPDMGHLMSLTAPGGEDMSFSYTDDFLNGTQWRGPVVGAVGLAYDKNGRISSVSVNGTPIALGYDDDAMPAIAGALTVARDPLSGLPASLTLGSVVETVAFDGFGGLAKDRFSAAGNTLYDLQLSRDKLGRITTKIETVGGATRTFGYAYDEAGRLTEVKQDGATIETYTYDPNGNRLTSGATTATYDAQDRILRFGETSYTYNANGDLLTRTSGGRTTAYSYDALGNLRSVVLPDGTRLEYVVDGLNRRVGKKVNGTLTQGFLYQDRIRIAAELDGNNAVLSRFVYLGEETVPAYMIKAGQTYRIIADPVGSVRLVVDSASGAVAQRIDYDSFGSILADSSPGFQPFGFAGGLVDQHTKLTRFGVRDYDAEIGRWTTKDPLLFAGLSANLYAYAFNDPVNFSDPDGRFFCKLPFKFKFKFKFKIRGGIDIGFGVGVGFDFFGIDGGFGFGAGVEFSQGGNVTTDGSSTFSSWGTHFSAGAGAAGGFGAGGFGEGFSAGFGAQYNSSHTNISTPFTMPPSLPSF